MPDDVAQEKVNALQALGADVQRVRPASIVDKKQVRADVVITKFSYNAIVMAFVVRGEQSLCRVMLRDEYSLANIMQRISLGEQPSNLDVQM